MEKYRMSALKKDEKDEGENEKGGDRKPANYAKGKTE